MRDGVLGVLSLEYCFGKIVVTTLLVSCPMFFAFFLVQIWPLVLYFTHLIILALYSLYSATWEINHNKSHDMTKPTKWLCAQRRLRSDWASAQSYQSLHCVLSGLLRIWAFFMRTAKSLSRLGGCPNLYESSLGAHSFCWFCHVAAHKEFLVNLESSCIGNQTKFLTINRFFILDSPRYMSPVKRICVFEHSIMTNFNCACPAIQRGQGSGFLSESSSWFTACMSEQRRFWRDCTDAQARLNLRCSHRW